MARTLHPRRMEGLGKGELFCVRRGRVSHTIELWVVHSLYAQTWDSQAGVLAMLGSVVPLQAASCMADFVALLADDATAHCEWWWHGLSEF